MENTDLFSLLIPTWDQAGPNIFSHIYSLP